MKSADLDWSEEFGFPEPWHGRYPDFEVGDVVYSVEMEDGWREAVVLYKNQDDYCLAVLCEKDNAGPRWLWKTFSRSFSDAARVAAEWDIDYHSRHLEYAKRVLAACDSGASEEELKRMLVCGVGEP